MSKADLHFIRELQKYRAHIFGSNIKKVRTIIFPVHYCQKEIVKLFVSLSCALNIIIFLVHISFSFRTNKRYFFTQKIEKNDNIFCIS